MYNKINKHTKNGLVQKKIKLFNTGFDITISIGTGVDGETTSLFISDNNLYADEDSRSERNPNLIVPFDDTEDLVNLRNLIDKALEERNLTLVKQK